MYRRTATNPQIFLQQTPQLPFGGLDTSLRGDRAVENPVNNTRCPIIDTFVQSLMFSDSHFNGMPLGRWMLCSNDTW